MAMSTSRKEFNRALAINQVGATALKTPKGTLYKVGGGLFTKRQVVASRRRFARVMMPKLRIPRF